VDNLHVPGRAGIIAGSLSAEISGQRPEARPPAVPQRKPDSRDVWWFIRRGRRLPG
jgi:hypothetical protein